MDKKIKILSFVGVLLGFTLLMVGMILIFISSLQYNVTLMYTSFVLLGLGILIYIVIVIMLIIKYVNKDR